MLAAREVLHVQGGDDAFFLLVGMVVKTECRRRKNTVADTDFIHGGQALQALFRKILVGFFATGVKSQYNIRTEAGLFWRFHIRAFECQRLVVFGWKVPDKQLNIAILHKAGRNGGIAESRGMLAQVVVPMN